MFESRQVIAAALDEIEGLAGFAVKVIVDDELERYPEL